MYQNTSKNLSFLSNYISYCTKNLRRSLSWCSLLSTDMSSSCLWKKKKETLLQSFNEIHLKRVCTVNLCIRLQKGTTFHWDLMLTGFINILMSCLGLPWMHAAFPHSSLHARQLAKVEQHVENGHLYTTWVKLEREQKHSSTLTHIEVVADLKTPILVCFLQWHHFNYKWTN